MKSPNTTTYDQPTYPETMRERVTHLRAENKRLREGVAYYIRQARMHRTMCIGYMKASTNLLTLNNAVEAKRDTLQAQLTKARRLLRQLMIHLRENSIERLRIEAFLNPPKET